METEHNAARDEEALREALEAGTKETLKYVVENLQELIEDDGSMKAITAIYRMREAIILVGGILAAGINVDLAEALSVIALESVFQEQATLAKRTEIARRMARDN